MKKTMIGLVLLLPIATVTLTACMTPRQVEALQLINDAEREGRISSATAEILREGIDPQRWVYDILLLLSSLGVGAAGGIGSARRTLRKANESPANT